MTGILRPSPWAKLEPEPDIQHTPWQSRLGSKVAAVHQSHDFESTDHTSKVFVGVADKEQTGPLINYYCWAPQWVNIGEAIDGGPCTTCVAVFATLCKKLAALKGRNPLALVLDLDTIAEAERAGVINLVKEMATGCVMDTMVSRLHPDEFKFVAPPVIILMTEQIKPDDKFEGFTVVM
jgi:hypothetical protein